MIFVVRPQWHVIQYRAEDLELEKKFQHHGIVRELKDLSLWPIMNSRCRLTESSNWNIMSQVDYALREGLRKDMTLVSDKIYERFHDVFDLTSTRHMLRERDFVLYMELQCL